MTYKLEPSLIERIHSPITLILPDVERLYFKISGELLETAFDRPYRISIIEAEKNSVVLYLEESEVADVPFDGVTG